MASADGFKGKIVEVSRELVTFPNGVRARFEIVRHPGGAAVLAVDAERRVCLLRHYRPVLGEWLWEIPAGKRDDDEDLRLTAKRELAEEVGLEARRWRSLGTSVSSPGVFTERVSLFLATELHHAGQATPAREELFEVHWLELERALELAREGTVCDAKSVIALWRGAAALAD